MVELAFPGFDQIIHGRDHFVECLEPKTRLMEGGVHALEKRAQSCFL